MHLKQRFCSVALITLISILLSNDDGATADEGDSRLRKRIAELEGENRELRKIIAGIQTALKSVPASTIAVQENANGLRIMVVPGEWGESQLADIRKVCESAGGTIAAQLTDDGFAPILVQRGMSGPITLYQRGEGNAHIVKLDTGNRAWAQCAFQFAHEFCHIVCNYRSAKNPQKWFEETLCECASLYALRAMAEEWKTNPPYSNWKSYSTSLASYASDRAKKYTGNKQTVAQFYQANLAELEKTGTNRELNTFIAVNLLPIFEETPESWQALRYLNLGPATENSSFKTYLAGWHNRVPQKHKSFVQKVAAQFGIELPTKTQGD